MPWNVLLLLLVFIFILLLLCNGSLHYSGGEVKLLFAVGARETNNDGGRFFSLRE